MQIQVRWNEGSKHKLPQSRTTLWHTLHLRFCYSLVCAISIIVNRSLALLKPNTNSSKASLAARSSPVNTLVWVNVSVNICLLKNTYIHIWHGVGAPCRRWYSTESFSSLTASCHPSRPFLTRSGSRMVLFPSWVRRFFIHQTVRVRQHDRNEQSMNII